MKARCPHCGGALTFSHSTTTRVELEADTLDRQVVDTVAGSDRPLSAAAVERFVHRRGVDVRAALARAERDGQLRRDDAGRWTA